MKTTVDAEEVLIMTLESLMQEVKTLTDLPNLTLEDAYYSLGKMKVSAVIKY